MATWREYQLSNDNFVIAKRCQSAHGLSTDVVICIHRDFRRVKIWLNQGEEISSVLRDKPQMILDDTEIVPSALLEWVGWEDATRVIEFNYGVPFYESYPAGWYVEALISKLHSSSLPGWVYYTLGGSGFSLLKDFVSWGEENSNAVEVSDRGISIYRSSLESGCRFTDDERLLFADTGVINAAERIKETSCWEHAEEILNVHRSLRRWIFHIACVTS